MIFQAELDKARQTQKNLEERLQQLTAARTRVSELLAELTRYLESFEQRLAQARQTQQKPLLPTYDAPERRVRNESISLDDHRGIRRERDTWFRAIARVSHTRDKLDLKIRHLTESKVRLDFWILDKEETWCKIDPQTLAGQVREILLAGEELSQLIVGRQVAVAFDTRDESPLGYVPIQKEKKGGRKIHLSGQILAEQPEHLLDYYRALIVHELGHVLLHLKDSGKDYRRLRRLIRERISLAPEFFALFNILLDQQLERILRDTKPEWQRWFNRLDFYTRRLPLRDFKAFLTRNGRADPDKVIADLAARNLIKVYADPRQPFATIQSAAIFSEGLGFSRLFAFFAVVTWKLPLATIQEGYLQECLDRIPKNFKSLDVFEVHAIAVEIYKILMRGTPGFQLLTVKIARDGIEGTTPIELPGVWLPAQQGDWDKDAVLVLQRKPTSGQSGGRAHSERKERRPSGTPSPNSEGDPPPPRPPAPQVYRQPTQTGGKQRSRSYGSYGGYGGSGGSALGNDRNLPAWAIEAIGGRGSGKGTGKGSKKGKAKLSAKEKLDAKQRSGRLSAREKARLQKEAREEARREAERNRPQEPIPPKQFPPPPPPPAPPPPSGPDEVTQADLLASASSGWSASSTMNDVNRALDDILKQVRAEMARKLPEPAIDRITPEGGRPSDHKNVTDVREFPRPQRVLRLLPNRQGNLALMRSVKSFVPVLRPWFAVADPEKNMQERLPAGRRLLVSGLQKHLAYGETRVFADLRLVEMEQHSEVLVCVLIDTSASMQTDGRLERAKRMAALLGQCLEECPHVESVFLGYNQNVYLCGNHEEHALSSLAPAGKTNEAAALDHLRKHYLDLPRRRKVVITLSDGLPTICSVESVRWLVRSLENELGVRCLHGAMSAEQHPAYRRRANLTGEINGSLVRAFGRTIAALLR